MEISMKLQKSLLLCVALSALAGFCFARSMQTSSPEHSVKVEHFNSVPEVKYPWGTLRWLMSGKIDPGAEQTFGVVEIGVGQRNALHSHPNSEELLYVLSGSCEHIVGNQKVVLHPGDLVRIPRNTTHQAIVLGNEPLRAVISYSTPDRQVVNVGGSKE